MNIQEVRKGAFAMPLTKPAFPAGIVYLAGW
jgi:acetoacetate decarboxylase